MAVQHLRPIQRVLVLGWVAGIRNERGWFEPADVVALFDALRLPRPSRIGRSLAQLRGVQLVRAGDNGSWSVTPMGDAKIAELMGQVDFGELSAELVGAPGADFASALHTTIAPPFAPARWQAGIGRLLGRFPFEQNVFCMTRFPDKGADLPDPIPAVIGTLREVMRSHGLVLHVASDRQAEDDLLGNVGAYMWACQYGIGLLEDRLGVGTDINDNVLIELGSMLVTGRRCAILRDTTAPRPPTDLSGQIYKSVDFDNLDGVAAEAHRWAAEDLGLGRCAECPVSPPTGS